MFAGGTDYSPQNTRIRFEDLNPPKRIRSSLPIWMMPLPQYPTTPSKMNSFFNSSFPERNIRAAWYENKTKTRALHLQPFNDYLFDVVSKHILNHRNEIYSALLEGFTTDNSSTVSVPLWTYNMAFYPEAPTNLSDSPDFPAVEKMIRSKGYRWMVGLADPHFNAENVDCGEGWESAWLWNPRPRSVHDVVRWTDFRNRIALMFGNSCFRVSYNTVMRKWIPGPLEILVEQIELHLHYHPGGLYESTHKAILNTKLKYDSYVSAHEYHHYFMPYVWSGIPSQCDTPKPKSMPSSPPPLPRRSNLSGESTPNSMPPLVSARSNGMGLSADDISEISRRLSFEQAPSSVHDYSGTNALEQCASDAVAEWNREQRACYCGYHYTESE